MPRNTFKKEERLTNKQTIEKLFSTGKSINSPAFKLIWKELAGSKLPAQILISVPKKSFRGAVARNRIKRKIREAYRKNKHALYEILNKKHLSVVMALVYTEKEELTYSAIEKNMLLSLQKVTSKYS